MIKRNKLGQFAKGSHSKTGFKKGGIPWNKNKKGLQRCFEKTRRKMSKAHKGLKLSEETKKKIILANTKTKVIKICLNCGKKFKTYPYRKDTAKYCSHSCAIKSLGAKELLLRFGDKRIKKGKKNWNWKGGITPENQKIRMSIEFRLWREAVFARDNWTCQKYKIRGEKLHAHHIQNFSEYPDLRFAIDNGITLSKKAHREFHKIYGNRNNTREQLVEGLIARGEGL